MRLNPAPVVPHDPVRFKIVGERDIVELCGLCDGLIVLRGSLGSRHWEHML